MCECRILKCYPERTYSAGERIILMTGLYCDWAVVVAQLVEQSLAIPEVHGSSPVIGKIYSEHLFTVNCIEKMNIQKKRPGMAHFYKIQKLYYILRTTHFLIWYYPIESK